MLREGRNISRCLFGWDNPEREDDQIISKFREKLISIDQEYNNAKIEIWQQNKLIGFLKPFPSLVIELKKVSGLQFQTHKSWSQNGDMQKPLVQSPDYDQMVESIQQILRATDRATHIRIIGEAGVGKTRFILEATKAEDIAPLVVYTKADNFIRSILLTYICRDDNVFHVVAIVDECNNQQRIELWNLLKNRGPRIKLITIYNETESREYGIDYPDIPLLSIDEVKRIILNYGILQDQVNRWAELAGDSPRFAHMIGTNLKYYPDDILRPVEGIYDRIIAGYEDPNSEEVKRRKRVLRYIALFKRFGYKKPFQEEMGTIAKIVEKADRDITLVKFQEIIETFRSQNILQGETTLYITPKALHIRMWIEWWNTYGSSFRLDEFLKDIPENVQLREWFYEMFKYAADSGVALHIVKELLGENGPFQNDDYFKKKVGARFFLALTEADPESALKCLKRTVGTWSKEELLHFITGRREVVWALERIAMWRDLFPDAARLLLALGEAENETWSNNSSGVFVQLFSPAYGKVAPTEASPKERFPVLREALVSDSKERRVLALRACDQALESQHFVRSIGAEHQGLRKEPDLWMPKTYGELFDAYRQVWQLLHEQLDSLPEDEQQQAVNIILHRSRELGKIQNLADTVIDTVDELAQKLYVDKKKFLSNVIQILHYDGKELPPKICQRWEQLKDELTGTDFSSLMRRYVSMDLLEDKFDEKGNHVDQTQPRIEKLAQQAVENNDLLRPELDWLVTTEAQNGYRFGYELGKRDKDFSLLPTLIEAQSMTGEDGCVYFLGGYFRALFEKDQQKWEKQLDDLSEDKNLNLWVPELTWRSGMSDQAALRILGLAEKSTIGIGHFRMFSLGSIIRDLSEDVFKKWIEFLLGSLDTHAISIALDLYHFYYIREESKYTLPQDLTLKLLTHQLLFQKSEAGRRDQMVDYHWTETGKVFVRLYPEKSLELVGKILEHFGENGTILEDLYSQTQSVLNEITRLDPHEVWKKITKYLGPPIDSRAFHIKEWLQGGEFFKEKEGILTIIPLESIWKWVDDDVEKRAWYLASFVPKILFREEGKICLAREVLVRYGTREDVRRNLIANFSTEGWSGPASIHYQRKKQQLLDFKEVEYNENVKHWIDEYVSSLDREIERAKIEEERDEF